MSYLTQVYPIPYRYVTNKQRYGEYKVPEARANNGAVAGSLVCLLPLFLATASLGKHVFAPCVPHDDIGNVSSAGICSSTVSLYSTHVSASHRMQLHALPKVGYSCS